MHISKVTYNPFPCKTLNERRHKIFAHFLFSQKTLYTKTDSQKEYNIQRNRKFIEYEMSCCKVINYLIDE